MAESYVKSAVKSEKSATPEPSPKPAYEWIYLPRDRKKFDGNVLDYVDFRDNFVNAYMSNPKCSPTNQLAILKDLVSGRAAAILRHVKGQGAIETALKVLDEHYESAPLREAELEYELNHFHPIQGDDVIRWEDLTHFVGACLEQHLASDKFENHSALISRLLAKMPLDCRVCWVKKEKKHGYRDLPGVQRLERLHDFIGKIASDLRLAVGPEKGKTQNQTEKKPQKKRLPKEGKYAVVEQQDPPTNPPPAAEKPAPYPGCPLCNEKDRLAKCGIFAKMEPDAQVRKVFEYKLCFNCLNGHSWTNCLSTKVCDADPDCKFRHHPLLHGAKLIKELIPPSPKPEPETPLHTMVEIPVMSTCAEGSPFNTQHTLRLVSLDVRGPSGLKKTVPALLDPGCARTTIKECLARELGLESKATGSILVQTAIGISCRAMGNVSFAFKGSGGTDWFLAEDAASVLDLVTPSIKINWKEWIKQHSDFSDVVISETTLGKAQVIIGIDNKVLMLAKPGTTCMRGKVLAYQTPLGWTVSGCVSNEDGELINAAPSFSSWEYPQKGRALLDEFRRFNSLEEVGIQVRSSGLLYDQEKELKELEKDVQIVGGRFQVSMLWKPSKDPPEVGELESPEGSSLRWITQQCVYVDDLYAGFDSVAEATDMVNRIDKSMAKYGFVMTKWKSNFPEVLAGIPEERQDKSSKVVGETKVSKALGLLWDPETDLFEKFWLEGPKWFSVPEEDWPHQPKVLTQGLDEVKTKSKALSGIFVLMEEPDPYVECNRIIDLVPEEDRKDASKILTFEKDLAKSAQQRFFVDELKRIQKEGKMLFSSGQLAKLMVWLDQEGLLRAETRLGNVQGISDVQKYPIVLPRHAPVSKLVIRDAHCNNAHAGAKLQPPGVLFEFGALFTAAATWCFVWICARFQQLHPSGVDLVLRALFPSSKEFGGHDRHCPENPVRATGCLGLQPEIFLVDHQVSGMSSAPLAASSPAKQVQVQVYKSPSSKYTEDVTNLKSKDAGFNMVLRTGFLDRQLCVSM
ncbi:unnamed protein product [Notodromas monacha]|uniref:Peptidase A2 domain-containing protein n=1 Tax=Notodromas monacha TaxID=399045 RepID=A0A7R9GG94_9CRUS|nr:unnamed protein product [Notodromas monacha]CAG0919972.1 unnamed protein product [Notodromas monacha]